MNTTETDDDYPLYSVINLLIGDEGADVTIMFRGVRFYVRLRIQDLESSQQQQFRRFRQSIDDDMEDFEEWILSPSFTYLYELAPASSPQTVTLQQYFNPVTYVFKVISVDGRLQATRCPYDPKDLNFLSPIVPNTEPGVSSAFRKGISSFSAADLEIIRAPDASEDEQNYMPRVVCSRGTRYKYAFKPALERDSFRRELDSLVRMRNYSGPLSTSKLAGIVTWEGEDSIMGLLLQHIEHQGPMDEVFHEASEENREKWGNQIQQTVEKLHAIGVIWGDVEPSNVLIDSKGDAFVIDFGGGFSSKWVDEKLEGTKAGDLQGVCRIHEFLGLKQTGH